MRRNSAKIGAELPKGVKPDGLPSEFTQQISEFADYVYSKMKDQILLVNEMRSSRWRRFRRTHARAAEDWATLVSPPVDRDAQRLCILIACQ